MIRPARFLGKRREGLRFSSRLACQKVHPPARPAGRSGLDVQRLQDSFARMAMHGDAVPLFFYSDLFLRHPETRDLFPV